MFPFKKGDTSVIVPVKLINATTGAPYTGLAYNSAGVSCAYWRPGGTPTGITLVTQTVTGAWTSGGFVELSSSLKPGEYRLDLPDAVCATGVDYATVSISFTGVRSETYYIYLMTKTANDNFAILADAVYGLAKLVRSTTPANALTVTASGQVDVNDLSGTAKASVNAEMLDVMNVDIIPERTIGAPPSTTTAFGMLTYLYMGLINKVTMTNALKSFYNAAGTLLWRKAVSETSGTYTEDKGIT